MERPSKIAPISNQEAREEIETPTRQQRVGDKREIVGSADSYSEDVARN